MAPHRVRRLAHSLKRDIVPAAIFRQYDSPMSMTSPRTTLIYGQDAPLAYRSSAAPHSTVPQRQPFVFLRRDLRHPGRLLRSYAVGRDSHPPPAQAGARESEREDQFCKPLLPAMQERLFYQRHYRLKPPPSGGFRIWAGWVQPRPNFLDARSAVQARS